MLQFNDRALYVNAIIRYKQGNRLVPNTPDYAKVVLIEAISPSDTKNLRESQGLTIPSLTYIETMPTTTTPAPKPSANEQLFSVATQPQVLNVGLPAGTTPTATTTETTTSESFITKYKMPLIIGAIAVGYMLFKKK